jgi:hypothetical protein
VQAASANPVDNSSVIPAWRIASWQRLRRAEANAQRIERSRWCKLRDLLEQASCGHLRLFRTGAPRRDLPKRLGAIEFVDLTATAHKVRHGQLLQASAADIARALGCSERHAVTLGAELVAAGWLEKLDRAIGCDGRDDECPMCHGKGPQHRRTVSNAWAPGHRLLRLLGELGAAWRACKDFGRLVAAKAVRIAALASRSANRADRPVPTEDPRRPEAGPARQAPDQNPPAPPGACGAGGAASPLGPDPEAGEGRCPTPAEVLAHLRGSGSDLAAPTTPKPRPSPTAGPIERLPATRGPLCSAALSALFAGHCECSRCKAGRS